MPLKQSSTPPASPKEKGKTVVPPKDGKKPSAKAAAKPAEKKASAAKKASRAKQPPPLIDLSTDRQLDILGIFLALGGLLTLFSATQSSDTGAILSVLNFFFGNGIYVLSVALIGFGVWLVIRKIDRIPPISVERVTGLILLFLLVQTAIHGLTGDGGWFGRVFYQMLSSTLGLMGMVIALLAWLLIALIMSFDVTVPELVGKLKPLFDFLTRFWATLAALLQNRLPEPDSPLPPAPAEDGYVPLTPVTAPAADKKASPAPVGIPITTSSKDVAWKLPNVKDILETGSAPSENQEYIKERAKLIEETLASFSAPAKVVETNRGPTITQFGVEPLFVETRSGRMRVRVSKIVSLSDDLALALAAPRIRIQAPVPGRSYVGIEVPNEEMTLVTLRDILDAESFQRSRKTLSFALGSDVSGQPIGADLAGMPHLLIAGTTGSGKSVCVNAILTALLLYNTPDELRLILVDPKRVELTGYNGIPHLLSPVVVEMDQVIGALQWMTREMDRRYHTFAEAGARNITDYNTRVKTKGGGKKLPYLVVIIDELADLMMIAPDETERTIARLAQLARATGIHLILATQRPSVDVVTGIIKANFPARVAFAVASNVDSRVILDQPGAERLLGRGDMLFQAPDAASAVRLQGVFVSDREIHKLVEFWQRQNAQTAPTPPGGAVNGAPSNVPLKQVPLFEDITAIEQSDALYTEAVDLVRREGRASVSMLQRRLRIGYTRAARLVDAMEEKGIVGEPEDNTGVRKVLDYGPAAPPNES